MHSSLPLLCISFRPGRSFRGICPVYLRRRITVRTTEKQIEKVFAESCLRKTGFVMDTHHCHPYYELYYLEKGACRFMVEENMYDLHTGDFLLIPPQIIHYTRYLFGDCRRDDIFFRMEDLSPAAVGTFPGQEEFFSQAQIFHVPDAYRDRIHALIVQMTAEEKTDDIYSPVLMQTFLQELLLLCCRICVFYDDAPDSIHTTDREIVAAARFISEHYMEPVTAADIAAAAGFSPNYLSRKFKEAAGISIHQYLVFIRLRHAAQELISTDVSVTESSFHCGFTVSNYFKDAFKKAYGVTPSAYRKKHR